MSDKEETPPAVPKFDFSAFPSDTLFFDRREGSERRADGLHEVLAPPVVKPPIEAGKAPERRAKKERRKRIDPTTFEKQYTADEMEFMNAMQRFKVQSGKAFPSHGEVLRVALSLGYRRVDWEDSPEEDFVVAGSDGCQPETCDLNRN